MKRVLLTGAAGGVGRRLRRQLAPVYPGLRLSDIATPPDLAPGEDFVAADLAVLDQIEAAVDGVEGIVHLGGFSVEGPWETILQANIVGCYNLFEAARRKGVKRVVLASSNHVVGFYPRHRRIGTDAAVRPDSRYGVSKAFGEALAALYADKHGLRVLCLRIGHVLDAPVDRRRLAIWLAPEDLVQIVRIGLEHPDLRYEIFYGVSDNERCWWDNSRAYAYGYRPTGRAEDHRDAALAGQAKLPSDPVGDFFQGGPFCSEELDGPGERESQVFARRTDRASRLILAPPDRVYRALVDPAMVKEWLPPKGMRGTIDAFDPRPGGAFCITLTFDDSSRAQGKSSSNTDVVKGQFVMLETNRRVAHEIEFQSADPAFAGTMTMTWTLDPQGEGTLLAVAAQDVPVGITAEDHEAGMASSLSNLAAMIEGARHD